ncbi:hypothetical protein HWV62_29791 [Athelia sp. TMB]|nr:hypothetical protein HWV62_29791 [Athelia sp. TMB]
MDSQTSSKAPRVRSRDDAAYWDPSDVPQPNIPNEAPQFNRPNFRGNSRGNIARPDAVDPLEPSFLASSAPRSSKGKRTVSFSLPVTDVEEPLNLQGARNASSRFHSVPNSASLDIFDQHLTPHMDKSATSEDLSRVSREDREEYRPSDATLVDQESLGSRNRRASKTKAALDGGFSMPRKPLSIHAPGTSTPSLPFELDALDRRNKDGPDPEKMSRSAWEIRRLSMFANPEWTNPTGTTALGAKRLKRQGEELDHGFLYNRAPESERKDDLGLHHLETLRLAELDLPSDSKSIPEDGQACNGADRDRYDRRTHVSKVGKGRVFFHAALMKFGAPSHRNEAQLKAAARVLNVASSFAQLPNIIICSFEDHQADISETYWVTTPGRIWLGNLQRTHEIYRSVMHDTQSATEGAMNLRHLLKEPPLYPNLLRMIFAFLLSAMICPLAFGGSFLDAMVAGAGAFVLCLLQLSGIVHNPVIAPIFDSLELASKNMFCGSIRMVYALIYTLLLGFGLQVGSGAFLYADQAYSARLSNLADEMAGTMTILANFTSDNSSITSVSGNTGVVTFANVNATLATYIVNGVYKSAGSYFDQLTNACVNAGCFRKPGAAWYLRPPPFWAQFFIVPLFSLISSLNNLQPLWGGKYDRTQHFRNLVTMVVISSASFAANKLATKYVLDRTDIVSAVGAFAAGVMGNLYSRKFGGTAFTSMVTAVLFLVPSGLSAAGGITGNGDGVDIGGAMISVTVGVTVGLFMSQAVVYSFGASKTSAVMSF